MGVGIESDLTGQSYDYQGQHDGTASQYGVQKQMHRFTRTVGSRLGSSRVAGIYHEIARCCSARWLPPVYATPGRIARIGQRTRRVVGGRSGGFDLPPHLVQRAAKASAAMSSMSSAVTMSGGEEGDAVADEARGSVRGCRAGAACSTRALEFQRLVEGRAGGFVGDHFQRNDHAATPRTSPTSG